MVLWFSVLVVWWFSVLVVLLLGGFVVCWFGGSVVAGLWFCCLVVYLCLVVWWLYEFVI